MARTRKVDMEAIMAIEPTPDEDSPDMADLLERGLVKIIRRGRPPKSEGKLEPVSLRLPSDTLARLRASGAGWQTRLSQQITRWSRKLA